MWKQEYSNMFELENDYWWYRGIHELIEYFVRQEAAGERLAILDAGCGTGKLMMILNRYGDVSGFDFSEEAIRHSRERGIGGVKIQDLNEWEPPALSFHVVTCIDVLCHSAIRDVFSVLTKFHSCLKKDGILILNLPACECLRRDHDIVVKTVRRFRKNELGGPLRDAGFEIEVSSYRLAVLFLIILMRKLLRVFAAANTPSSDLKVLPSFVNSLMLAMSRAENLLISKGISSPLGSSLFIVARKKDRAHESS